MLLDKLSRRANAQQVDEQSPVSPISDDGSIEKVDEKVVYGTKVDEKTSVSEDSFIRPGKEDEEVQMLNGEPVITSGKDVSRFVVDLRDDGEAALTFRSLTIGTVFAGLGAALCEVNLGYDS